MAEQRLFFGGERLFGGSGFRAGGGVCALKVVRGVGLQVAPGSARMRASALV
jgi:hypothetical protein